MNNINTKLLSLLEQNARYSLEDLALMLGSDEKSIASEIDALYSDGIIRGYKALINWDMVDNSHVNAIIELKVEVRGFYEFRTTADDDPAAQRRLRRVRL